MQQGERDPAGEPRERARRDVAFLLSQRPGLREVIELAEQENETTRRPGTGTGPDAP